MEDKSTNTVTIPLEEYIDLKMRSENNLYLLDRLRQFEDELRFLDNRLREVEKV